MLKFVTQGDDNTAQLDYGILHSGATAHLAPAPLQSTARGGVGHLAGQEGGSAPVARLAGARGGGGLPDRSDALREGRIQPEGIDLVYLPLAPQESFFRMLRHFEFDASEMSLSAYTVAKSRGENRIIAIPVFTSREFRHSAIYINTKAGIEKPADLKGKRVGVPEYMLTAVVWARGILRTEYGVQPSEIKWLTGG